MNKVNYAQKGEEIIKNLSAEEKPRLLMHACCAPCSSACLEFLAARFNITLLYYNPNISPESEFQKRYGELKRLLKEMPCCKGVSAVDIGYDYGEFKRIARGMEEVPEGGERCFRCYRLRMEAAARYAKEHGYEWFCTTLTLSPLKNSVKINEIGYELQQEYGVKWLPSDFKKRDGYKRSIELSKEYNLYRQNYCGCAYSKAERERKEKEKLGEV